VGESGCGKSTMVSLLLRFYDVNEGLILIDGVDIKQWNLHSLRSAIGIVMQEPTLFNYTVEENILYGQGNAKNTDILEATRVSNASEFIESHQIENAIDNSAESIFDEYLRYRDQIIEKVGLENYE
jgi:ABC-type multidrug transport system fused ATPase/permease subunit